MSGSDGQSEFERRVGQALRDDSEALDGRTRSKLTQARHAALDGASARAGRGAWVGRGAWRWAPAGAVAAALLVTVMYVQQRSAVAPAEDLAMLADAEVYALNADTEHEPDYDFYEWAATAGPEVESGT
jgi:hypothetical protein